MMRNLKNIWIYYFSIITPLILLFLSIKFLNISDVLFVICLAVYLIYRIVIDGNRLYYKNIIKKADRWKTLIPFMRLKYFNELYLKK